MRLNKRGITRLVIELNTVVIKIPKFTYSWEHFLKGLLSNINENKLYKNIPLNKELLCPIVWCSIGGWILIMKKAKPLTEDIDYFEWEYAGLGGDDKPQNYGIYKDRIVKIDYGQVNF